MTQKVDKQRQDHAPCSMFDASAIYMMQKSRKHMRMLIFHAAVMVSTYWYILVHAKKENSNTAVRSVPQIMSSVLPNPVQILCMPFHHITSARNTALQMQGIPCFLQFWAHIAADLHLADTILSISHTICSKSPSLLWILANAGL